MGDGAATIDLGNHLSESLNGKVLAMHQWLEQNRFEGLKDIVTAYSSLTILYDTTFVKNYYQPSAPVFEWIKQRLITAYQQSGDFADGIPVRHRIPVHYGRENGMDIDALARQKQLTSQEVIRIHTSKVYRVYMIGFLPGFSYMAAVDDQIAQPRKDKPVAVPAGSVGIAGSQTGIYPFNGPGGWNIIGRTPMELFNAQAENPVLLKAGDEVVFYEA
jgi:inhibitor of KinA